MKECVSEQHVHPIHFCTLNSLRQFSKSIVSGKSDYSIKTRGGGCLTNLSWQCFAWNSLLYTRISGRAETSSVNCCRFELRRGVSQKFVPSRLEIAFEYRRHRVLSLTRSGIQVGWLTLLIKFGATNNSRLVAVSNLGYGLGWSVG